MIVIKLQFHELITMYEYIHLFIELIAGILILSEEDGNVLVQIEHRKGLCSRQEEFTRVGDHR
jgi:hypothetical protein